MDTGAAVLIHLPNPLKSGMLCPMRVTLLFFTILLTMTTGCTFKETYRVMLKNETTSPLTVGFVKNGPPAEALWASPEDLAIAPIGRERTSWGEVIEAGKTADVVLSGTFQNRVNAFLRVYQGKHDIDHLLAISRGGGNRVDIILDPGRPNAFIIYINAGKLDARLYRPAPPKQ